MKNKIIPIMHCFDNNYAIPAGVCFLPYVEHTSCPVSENISSLIACLPLYPDLSNDMP